MMEKGVSLSNAIVQGSMERRLSPICQRSLKTASLTALALMPIVLGGVKPGYEIKHPAAVVILRSLVTSTLPDLSLLMALYRIFGKLSLK